MQKQHEDRIEYEAPTIREIGDVAEITQGEETGTVTDDTFPAGTPFEDVTFSA